ncbi:MAG: hypothetical protein VB025_09130 [Sphaerochaeta sp.]|nr:hypothetical protein [Sphaerochaeta sp.]
MKNKANPRIAEMSLELSKLQAEYSTLVSLFGEIAQSAPPDLSERLHLIMEDSHTILSRMEDHALIL